MDRIIVVLLLLIPLTQGQVLVDAPATVVNGSLETIALHIHNASEDWRIVVGEDVGPADIANWTVIGAEDVSLYQENSTYIWEFSATAKSPVIYYSLRLHEDVLLDTIYALSPNLYGRKKNEVRVRPPIPTGTVVSDGRADYHLFPFFVIFSLVVLAGAFAFKSIPQRPPGELAQVQQLIGQAQAQLVQQNASKASSLYLRILDMYRLLEEEDKEHVHNYIVKIYSDLQELNKLK